MSFKLYRYAWPGLYIIDMLRALKSSLEHWRKHVPRCSAMVTNIYGDQAYNGSAMVTNIYGDQAYN